MPSKVDIINRALIEIGEELITSENDAVEQAEKASAVYNEAVEVVLGATHWKFATRRVVLAVESDDPAYGAFKRYAKPAHFVMLVPPDPDDDYEEEDIKEEGDYLLVPSSAYDSLNPQLNIRYITKDPNQIPEGKFPAAFAKAVALYIAMTLAYDFTGSAAAADEIMKKYMMGLKTAKAQNSHGETGVIVGGNEIINARQ